MKKIRLSNWKFLKISIFPITNLLEITLFYYIRAFLGKGHHCSSITCLEKLLV